MTFRSICVYAGSNVGTDPAYARAAEALGRLLAEREIDLVYGGGRAGLMGVVADAALAAGGRVVGITPHRFVEMEVIHTGLTELVVVDSMHQRKAAMAERSDAFVALPGGLGTVEELVEAATWTQLGIHAKPIGLFDAGGFWEPFDAFLEHCVATQFVRAEHRRAIVRHAEPEALLDALAAWRPVEVPKVLELDES